MLYYKLPCSKYNQFTTTAGTHNRFAKHVPDNQSNEATANMAVPDVMFNN